MNGRMFASAGDFADWPIAAASASLISLIVEPEV
jgi:hypothetical protein